MNGVETSRVRVAPKVPSVQMEQEGLHQHLEKMEQSLNILIAFVEEEILRKSKKEKNKRLKSLKDPIRGPGVFEGSGFGYDFYGPDGSGSRYENGFGSGSSRIRSRSYPLPSLPAAEVEIVDVPSQDVDVVKVELPRPTTDVHVPSAEVVNETDVLDQVISEEILFNSEKIVMGVVDQLNDS